MLSGLADAAIQVLRITAMVVLAGVFLLAINLLLSFITSILFPSVVGEVLAIMSACLPFNALAVFGAVGTVLNGILSFLIAKKIFDLSSWSISAM